MAHVIEQTTRRRDDDVGAVAQRVFLRAHADAAEYRRAAHLGVDRELLHVLSDLRSEFARRRQNERARRTAFAVQQALEDRKQERGRFAAARHRAREDVLAGERGRNRALLNGGGLSETELLDAAQEVRVQTELLKRHRRIHSALSCAGRACEKA